MNQERITRRLILYEIIGFALIIAVSWLNEIFALPALLPGLPAQPSWQEAMIETVVIVSAAIPTLLLTRRLGGRLGYLERFLRVCAWCRQVNSHGQWMPIEEFFRTEFKTETSHGMCPACAEKHLREFPSIPPVL